MHPDSRSSGSVSRRQWLRMTAAQAALAPVLQAGLSSGLSAAETYEPLQRYPRMVHNWTVAQVEAALERKERRLERLQNQADAEAYVKSVQGKIRRCFGPEPERTPLNANVTGVLERDTYKVEKVIFESRPGFPVTANLYLPLGIDKPVPGVIGTCGHSTTGKGEPAYQSFAQSLARLGYACLLYDPIGQGERVQYLDENLKSHIGVGVHEHLHAGNQQFLVGEFLGAWRAWDGVRALDYLLTRKEIDKDQLGVTGNSGGGTMTTWLCGVEPRFTMAAPSCFVTSFLRNLQNELPADTEQCPPLAISLGLDHDDFLAAMAPKPVIILSKERDYFDVRGGDEAYARLQRLYELLGAKDQVGRFVGPTTHGYSQENREAMYGWFHQATGAGPAPKEPELQIEKDADLWCTPHGQIGEAEGVRTIFDFTREKAERLAKSRGQVSGKALQGAITQVLQLPPSPETAPDYQIYYRLGSRDYPAPQAIAYAVDTEPGVQAIVYRLHEERWFSRPQAGGAPAVLYLSHHSSDAELRSEPLVKELIAANPKAAFYTCDVRGIGESQPDTCGTDSFLLAYGSDYFYAIHGLMLDRPYLGQRTFDVLRVLDWLADVGHTRIHLAGNGWGALPAALAGVLSDKVQQVTLKHALTSWSELASAEDYHWPLAAMPPNVLAHFDLPDCYRALQEKKLRQIEPWGPLAGEA
ncbi:alpha/beta hydrolase family protein [Lignipirellula cremea]|uniref:Alpha/beta hydrolase family protein n=1 Tax=Lignipirellula cremea TaxID=2528010 RepID=A0A518DNS3_9BACT|nr:prolyl oligopeptidase family serine peptidase [Lignipirellula cremea]QDU93488.1 Alpha/beta hydrolase family protein [Lignipirellula cremea]